MTFACPATEDFFRLRLDHMIDLRHPLAVLASRMPWQDIQASVAHLFSRKARSGKAMPDLDLFGEKPQRQAVASKAARPRVPLRTMIAPLYPKHAFNESDEAAVERWGETPTWQFFSGRQYFEHQRPCDATTLIKFRQLLGEEGVEELLAQTIQVAVDLKLIKPDELTRVIVDSTVQHKAIAPPTDSRLLEVARGKLVQAAKAAGIASTLRGNRIVGARAFHGNPYDGRTLNEQLEQAAILMQDTALQPVTAFVDLGYRGVDADNPEVRIVRRGKIRRISKKEKEQLRRGQAIEPIIGHLKQDHRMGRCHLKGEMGDRLHAVLCAAGYNIRWLLRQIIKKGVAFLYRLFLRLCRVGITKANRLGILRELACSVRVGPTGRLLTGRI